MNYISEYEEYEKKYKELNDSTEEIYYTYDRKLDSLEDKLRVINEQIEKLEEEKDKLYDQIDLIEKMVEEECNNNKCYFDEKYNSKFLSISFGEFGDELSDMLDEELELSAEFSPYPIYSRGENLGKEEIIKSYFSRHEKAKENSYGNISIRMNVKETPFQISVMFNSFLIYDFNNKPGDIFKHCSIQNYKYYNGYEFEDRCYLIIDKDIENIVLNFSFKDLASDFKDSYINISVSKDGYVFEDLDDFVKEKVKQSILNIMRRRSKEDSKKLDLKR